MRPRQRQSIKAADPEASEGLVREMMAADAPILPDVDPHRSSVRERLAEQVMAVEPRPREPSASREFERQRSMAAAIVGVVDEVRASMAHICRALEVEPLQHSDSPDLAAVRALANTQNRQRQVDGVVAGIQESRRLALSASAGPGYQRRSDGSYQGLGASDDYERQRAEWVNQNAYGGQAARHLAMATAGPPPVDPRVAFRRDLEAKERARREAES